MPTADTAAMVVHHGGASLAGIVLLALASAAAYGLAAVLQHHAAVRQPAAPGRRGGLVVPLARQPRWLVGSALDGVGYALQFLALRRGSLLLVEPLLVLSLVFSLPVTAWLDHRRASVADLAWAGVVVAGLALLLGASRPGFGHPRASTLAWAALSFAIAAVCAATVLGARGGPQRRAVLLASGSGIAFGYAAAVTERTGHLLGHGILHLLASWEPYALMAAGTLALLLTQSAFHAGDLRLSLPTLTVAQPLVAMAIGLGIFGERIDTSGPAPVAEVAGLLAVIAGVFLLARSPVIGLGPVGPGDGGTDGSPR